MLLKKKSMKISDCFKEDNHRNSQNAACSLSTFKSNFFFRISYDFMPNIAIKVKDDEKEEIVVTVVLNILKITATTAKNHLKLL